LNEERRRESSARYLVPQIDGGVIDSDLREPFRQLLIGHSAPGHLGAEQSFNFFSPFGFGLHLCRLLTAAARSLSLGQVLRLSDEEARAKFIDLRWSDNGGQPYCPHCGSAEVYSYRSRPIWRCKDCGKQFSVTSGTIFHSRKLPHRDYLAAIAIFVNAV
jgi:hypothetical protein